MNLILNLFRLIPAFFSFFGGAFTDGRKPSSGRTLALTILPPTYLVILYVWFHLSLSKEAIQEIPASVQTFLGTVTGPLLVFLHMNKRVESKQVDPGSNPPAAS
ncbi:MAG: hypothetical protein SFV32_12830 [Opitutaceae bacterium]|nr:hypothetical protein [Opitutaceae bacterium]